MPMLAANGALSAAAARTAHYRVPNGHLHREEFEHGPGLEPLGCRFRHDLELVTCPRPTSTGSRPSANDDQGTYLRGTRPPRRPQGGERARHPLAAFGEDAVPIGVQTDHAAGWFCSQASGTPRPTNAHRTGPVSETTRPGRNALPRLRIEKQLGVQAGLLQQLSCRCRTRRLAGLHLAAGRSRRVRGFLAWESQSPTPEWFLDGFAYGGFGA